MLPGLEWNLRHCPDCKVNKPQDDFYYARTLKRRRRICKDCTRIRYRMREFPPQVEGDMTCARCKQVKHVTRFSRNKSKLSGRNSWCKGCDAITHAKGNVTFTTQDIDHLIDASDGTCDICERHEDEVGRLRIDHDHETGKLRGLLCNHCNVGGGHYKEDPAILRKAADYFENPIDNDNATMIYSLIFQLGSRAMDNLIRIGIGEADNTDIEQAEATWEQQNMNPFPTGMRGLLVTRSEITSLAMKHRQVYGEDGADEARTLGFIQAEWASIYSEQGKRQVAEYNRKADERDAAARIRMEAAE